MLSEEENDWDDIFSNEMDSIYNDSKACEQNGLNRIALIIDKKIESCFEGNESSKNITLDECKLLVYSEIDKLFIDFF